MKKLALKFIYENPVHSLISDTADHIWTSYFTYEELNEISTYNRKEIPAFPEEYSELMDLLVEAKTARDIY
jgi:hypothetical protein